MKDKILNIDGSVLHYGKFSDRVYIMYLNPDKYAETFKEAARLSAEFNLGKIIACVPEEIFELAVKDGYVKEAELPNIKLEKKYFYISKFIDKDRMKIEDVDLIRKIIRKSVSKNQTAPSDLDKKYVLRKLTTEDAPEASGVYKKVFETYPFPIHDHEYIIKTMGENIDYFGIFTEDKLIALSSAEKNEIKKSVEMTDFATLPEYRGDSLAQNLLESMENSIKKEGYALAYTIARSISYGMNITFAKSGYKYSGTLVNNTNISGGLESMNIWHKMI